MIGINGNEYIKELKEKLKRKAGLKSSNVILTYNGEILDDNEKVEYYDIEDKVYIAYMGKFPGLNEKKNISKEDEKKEKADNDKYIQRIKELEEELKLYKEYFLSPGQSLISVNFISCDQRINFSVTAKDTDKFTVIENKLYDKYSNYTETENYFLVNGNKINRHKTLKENKIKNHDIITLNIMDL